MCDIHYSSIVICNTGLFCDNFTSQVAWLLKAATCIDLTTLSGDDTFTNVQRLCYKAKHPIRRDLLEAVGMEAKGTISLFFSPPVKS